MSEIKRYSLVKPTLNTPFHIDYEWWQNNDREWRIHLISALCPEHREKFKDFDNTGNVDWVDPETGEVRTVDGLQNALISHCAKQPDFISEQTSLVESVFRLFLANDNTPMSAVELSSKLGRPPQTILKTLSNPRGYKGIRPCPECK